MRNTYISSKVLWLMAGILGAAAPGFAQTVEEVIVTGRGQVPDNVKSLTQSVSYADLDLSTDAGKRELRHRVSLTARYLCDKLGESASSTGAVPSCRDAAVKDAMSRVGTLEAQAAPRGTTWVAGPAWKAPYPEAWVKTYPD
jgi:UrcA family protein